MGTWTYRSYTLPYRLIVVTRPGAREQASMLAMSRGSTPTPEALDRSILTSKFMTFRLRSGTAFMTSREVWGLAISVSSDSSSVS